MSVDPVGNPETPAEEPKKKKSTKAKIYKHLLTTVYKNDVAATLDKLEVSGHNLVAILPSTEIRGFEIITRFLE